MINFNVGMPTVFARSGYFAGTNEAEQIVVMFDGTTVNAGGGDDIIQEMVGARPWGVFTPTTHDQIYNTGAGNDQVNLVTGADQIINDTSGGGGHDVIRGFGNDDTFEWTFRATEGSAVITDVDEIDGVLHIEWEDRNGTTTAELHVTDDWSFSPGDSTFRGFDFASGIQAELADLF